MWNWSSGNKPVPSVHPNKSQTPFNTKTAPQTGYQHYQGYLPQAQNGGNFFYGYQGTFQPGYASYPDRRISYTNQPRFSQSYHTEPRKVSAVSQVRKSEKSLKRKVPKQPPKPPVLKRKDKGLSDASQSSSTYKVTSSETASPRSESPSSHDSHFGAPDLAQESVLGRASILVLDDYRSSGHQSIGSRSAKSRTSTSGLREYRPSHIPDPVVPGFSFSSDEDKDDEIQNKSGNSDGKGYTRSLGTTPPRSASKQLAIGFEKEEESHSVPQFLPTPPPLAPLQPLYATVNKENKPLKPNVDDPIYSTIDEAKKQLVKQKESTSNLSENQSGGSKPLTLLGELKQRFSLRSKGRVLDLGENPDIPGQSSIRQSAFRPYNAAKQATLKMDDQSEAPDYDTPIPIDKVLLKDGSEPSELQANGTETETGEQLVPTADETNSVKADDAASNFSNKASAISGDVPPSNFDINLSEAEKTESKTALANGMEEPVSNQGDVPAVHDEPQASAEPAKEDTPQPLPVLALPPPPVTQDQASHLSSVYTQSNLTTQSSNKSSQRPLLHEPITSRDFQPKSILKNKNKGDSSESSSSEESDGESEKEEEDNERYHLTIPVEVSEPVADTNVEEEKTEKKFTPPSSLRSAHKSGSESSLPGSLRAARKASISSFEESKRNVGVSFTSDTRDNEGLAKKYEKEGLALNEIYKGKIASKDAVATPNRIFNEDDQTPKVAPEPPAPVHESKKSEPVKEPEVKAEPDLQPIIEKQPKPATKDQAVSADIIPIQVIQAPKIQAVTQSIEPAKNQNYALVMKSPRGILKHPNGTATLQLNQPNQFVISTPEKCATLPNGSLTINTDLTGAHRGGGGGYSPTFKLVNQSPTYPSYTLRQTGDNISIVSIAGYDPAWETRSNYSSDTIRTIDDFKTGTIRTMVSLGTYTNPYEGNELVGGNNSVHYRRQISESSTDPLAFTMSYDSHLFEYNLKQNKQNGVQHSPPGRYKKRSQSPVAKKLPQKRPVTESKSVQKKTTFADHALGYDALFRKETRKKRKRRLVKIGAMVLVIAIVITTVALVIYFLTDNNDQQDSAEDQ